MSTFAQSPGFTLPPSSFLPLSLNHLLSDIYFDFGTQWVGLGLTVDHWCIAPVLQYNPLFAKDRPMRLREAPDKKMPGLFGHCPNSDCTPPPFTQTGTLGHFISGPT